MNQETDLVLDKIRQYKTKALELGASDIFLSSGSKPALRIQGKTIFLEEEPELNSVFLEKYLIGKMGDEQRQAFGEKLEVDFAIDSDVGARFRVNTFWQMGGISIVFRHIPENVPDFDSLNLPEQLKKIVHYKNGLVLVTGAMGSGKSTTLASIVDLINRDQNKHIVTIEDPIEFVHKPQKSLVEQRELDIHTRDFSKALRACLRQAADVILVGELRDLDTIAAAVTAAETGALVLGTLHTNGATNSVNRLIDVFPAEQQNQIRTQLSEVLKCVVWQTLLPLKNEAKRVAGFEILFQNYAVSNLIREGKTYQLESVIEMGKNEGMVSMKQTLDWLIEKDLISVDVAKRTLPHQADTFRQN